jgi:hypothetical protein
MPDEADRTEVAENPEGQLARVLTNWQLAWMALLMVLSMAVIVVLIAVLLP